MAGELSKPERTWRDRTWLVSGLAILVITPLIAIVVLSLWWLQAERASLDGQRLVLAERTAAGLAKQTDAALLRAIQPKHDAVMDANGAGGAAAVRGLMASDPHLAFAAVDGLTDQPDFPPAGEMMTFYEDWVLQRNRALLAKARGRMGTSGEPLWLGSALIDGPGVVSCRPVPPDGSACIVLEGSALRSLAEEVFGEELGDHPDRPAIVQGDDIVVWANDHADHGTARRMPLGEPFAAWAVSVPLIETSAPVLPKQVVFIVAILATLLAAAAFLYWNHERHVREAGQRVELLAQIAHELRTPLANLQLYAALLQKKDGQAETTRYCDVLEQECTRLSGLIENTLSLARAGRKGASEPRDGNPDAIVGDIVERFGPLLESHRSSVSLDLGAGRDLHFDRLAFERILINLIDNACTHAPGAAIRIWTRAEGARLDFGVEDEGNGIARDKQPAIFDAFETSRVDGFGLGLATCRSLAEAAGGAIRYDGRARGASFHVHLPILPGLPEAAGADPSPERQPCAS